MIGWRPKKNKPGFKREFTKAEKKKRKKKKKLLYYDVRSFSGQPIVQISLSKTPSPETLIKLDRYPKSRFRIELIEDSTIYLTLGSSRALGLT